MSYYWCYGTCVDYESVYILLNSWRILRGCMQWPSHDNKSSGQASRMKSKVILMTTYSTKNECDLINFDRKMFVCGVIHNTETLFMLSTPENERVWVVFVWRASYPLYSIIQWADYYYLSHIFDLLPSTLSDSFFHFLSHSLLPFIFGF